MAKFKPSGPADLNLLKAGLCPECGAALSAGMTACKVCKVELGEYAVHIPAPKAAAPAAVASSPAGAARPAAPAPAATGPAGGGLTAAQIDELERGQAAHARFPLSGAAGPESLDQALALGAALVRALPIVMADAALADDPAALAGNKKMSSALPLLVINRARSASAATDDADALLASRPGGPPAPAPPAPALARPAAPAPSAAPAAPAPPAPPAALASTPPRVPHAEARTEPDMPRFDPNAAVDPDATQQLTAEDVAAAVEAAQRRAQSGAPAAATPPVSARGGAHRIDE